MDVVSKRTSSSPRTISVFDPLLGGLSRRDFATLVSCHGAERYTKGFSWWAQPVGMPFSLLAQPLHLSLQRVLEPAFAGILARLPVPDRCPEDFPLSYNAERDLRLIAGPLHLRASDRAKFRKDPGRLKAVEALTEVYR